MNINDQSLSKLAAGAIAIFCFSALALAEHADYVLRNASVYTVDAASPWAESIGVKGGKIIFVGSNKDAEDVIGSNTKVLDLDGKMVMPGFIDTHAHPIVGGGASHHLPLSSGGSPEKWLSIIEQYVEENPDAEYVFGIGFNAAAFGPEGPTKEMLDGVVSDRPALILDDGGHTAWANSRLLKLAGIDNNTPDPVPGTHYYQRDENGRPTGFLVEAMTFFPILRDLGMINEQTILEGAGFITLLYSQFGITTVFDAGFHQHEKQAYPTVAKMAETGMLPFRLVTSYTIQSPLHVDSAIETLRRIRGEYSSELVQPRVMKIHNDGTVQASTAALFEDYPDQPGNTGSLLLEGKVLQDFVVSIDEAGFDVQIHAIGDRAVAEALDAFEVARKANPNSKSRFSIAHTSLVRDQDLTRFSALDVVAQTTPFWFSNSEKGYDATLDNSRVTKLFRFRKIADSGGKVTFGSDFPVTGELFGISPLPNIEMGMTRKFYGASDMSATPPVNSLLTLEEMIRGYTLDAAYQLNMENDVGSLEVGKFADLVVLGANLFDLDVYDIHRVKVEMTMMNGDIVFERYDQAKALEQQMGFPQ